MPDFDDLQFNKPEDEVDFSNMSLDDLLESTKEELEEDEAAQAAEGGPADTEPEQPAPKHTFPRFEPTLPEEYADLTVDEETEEEEPMQQDKPRLAPGLRVLLYICCVLAVSVLLAVGAWTCADDVLALTKPNRTMTVTIADNATIDDVTRELHDNGLVNYPWLFKFYCWYSHAEQKITPGTYTLNNIYDYHALVNAMRETSQQRSTVEITIPEGYECKDIFALLEEKGVCSVEKLQKAAAEYEFDYDFLADLPYGDSNRLEGYLFPDTYQFYLGDEPENVIGRFLRNFDRKLTQELRDAVSGVNEKLAAKMEENGFTQQEIRNSALDLHDIIIVASLIEKETAKTSESANIASVIYNRLCSKLYPCLEIDATIQYALPERKEVLSDADKSLISPYNTYTNAGLPAGPISNPGINSIRAALYPADTDYYFYALNKSGVHTFSETYYEHQEVLAEMEH